MAKSGRSWLFAVALLGVGQSATPLLAQEAASQGQRPDFSGVWTLFSEPGADPFAGFSMARPELPFTAEGKRLRDEYLKLTFADASPLGGDNPGAHCVQYGMPTMMEQAGGYPIEFIYRPEQLTIIYEVEGEIRRVYLAGPSTPVEKRLPSRQGYSEGRWEGDTLVVTTTDMNDGVDQQTYPHSEEATIVERFRLVPHERVGKVLEYEMTLTDPVYYTQPVSFTKRWMPLKDGRILAYPCTEEPWLRLIEARREQFRAGQPITAKMKDVVEIYED